MTLSLSNPDSNAYPDLDPDPNNPTTDPSDDNNNAILRAKWTGTLMANLYCNPADADCDPDSTGPTPRDSADPDLYGSDGAEDSPSTSSAAALGASKRLEVLLSLLLVSIYALHMASFFTHRDRAEGADLGQAGLWQAETSGLPGHRSSSVLITYMRDVLL